MNKLYIIYQCINNNNILDKLNIICKCIIHNTLDN